MRKITLFLLSILSTSLMFGQYCLPTYNSACTSGDFINSFTLNTISNTGTGCSGPGANNYTDYSATISTSLTQGSTYSVTVIPGPSWGQYFAVWIDFNQDGDFDELNEFFDIGYAASGATITTPITIPVGVLGGATRLRVLCKYSTGAIFQPGACDNYSYGETEDYEVIITPPLPEISNVFIAVTLDTIVNTCTQDGNPDTVIMSNSSTSSLYYTYVMTDGSGNITSLPANDTTDFDSYPFGISRIYGVSHIDTLVPGATLLGSSILTSILAPDSFIVSTNYVEVIRWEDIVSGGMVSTITGDTAINVCAQDTVADIFTFNTTSTSTANFAYIMTSVDDTIRAISGSTFDFDSIAPGTSHIYGLSYNGDLDSTVIDSLITNAVFSNGCYNMSSNYVEVTHLMNNTDTSYVSEMITNAILVSLSDIGNGDTNFVDFSNSTPSIANYAYVITDNSGNILAFPSNNRFDFENSGATTSRVYGVSYNGDLDSLIVGSNINSASLSNACYTLSNNWIEVITAFSVGVNTINKKNLISIYPNPAKESIKVNGLENGVYKIDIINTLGAVVIEKIGYKKNSDINISQLKTGVYFMKIINEKGEVSTHKIIKK